MVVNLTTSSVIDDIAARHNRRVFRTPVGEANVVERMQRAKAVIGGEGSNGGIIFPAVQFCRDSYTGMAFLLDLMAAAGQPVTALAARLPHYTRKSGSVAYQHGRLAALMQDVEDAFTAPQIDRTDGLKLIWPGRWIHVRSSNTEPILRFAVESSSELEAEEMFENVRTLAAAH